MLSLFMLSELFIASKATSTGRQSPGQISSEDSDERIVMRPFSPIQSGSSSDEQVEFLNPPE